MHKCSHATLSHSRLQECAGWLTQWLVHTFLNKATRVQSQLPAYVVGDHYKGLVGFPSGYPVFQYITIPREKCIYFSKADAADLVSQLVGSPGTHLGFSHNATSDREGPNKVRSTCTHTPQVCSPNAQSPFNDI
ncbi:hypothetical protein DPMN_131265 [Dreissena polymorpha]|uniref:Uncharacterized protein n=1 Tax=Dreissena polymorpha TaxID=45954 RepID=A0A9D4H694_DREPO|nr:hypothetical protein DPMN_131265 [Dreissena polymorpha]